MPHNKWPMTLGSILSPGPSWHTTTQYDRYFPKKVFIAILSTFSESPMSQWPEWCKLTHCRIINASNTKDLRFKLTPYFPQNLFCTRIFFAPFFHIQYNHHIWGNLWIPHPKSPTFNSAAFTSETSACPAVTADPSTKPSWEVPSKSLRLNRSQVRGEVLQGVDLFLKVGYSSVLLKVQVLSKFH